MNSDRSISYIDVILYIFWGGWVRKPKGQPERFPDPRRWFSYTDLMNSSIKTMLFFWHPGNQNPSYWILKSKKPNRIPKVTTKLCVSNLKSHLPIPNFAPENYGNFRFTKIWNTTRNLVLGVWDLIFPTCSFVLTSLERWEIFEYLDVPGSQ